MEEKIMKVGNLPKLRKAKNSFWRCTNCGHQTWEIYTSERTSAEGVKRYVYAKCNKCHTNRKIAEGV